MNCGPFSEMIRGLASANPSGRWSGGSHPMGAELIVRNDDQPHTIPQDASQPVEKLAQKLLALLGECDSKPPTTRRGLFWRPNSYTPRTIGLYL